MKLTLLSLLSSLFTVLFSSSPKKLSIHPLFIKGQLAYFSSPAGQSSVVSVLQSASAHIPPGTPSESAIYHSIITVATELSAHLPATPTLITSMLPLSTGVLTSPSSPPHLTASVISFLITVFEYPDGGGKDTGISIDTMSHVLGPLIQKFRSTEEVPGGGDPNFDDDDDEPGGGPIHCITSGSVKVLPALYSSSSSPDLYSSLLSVLVSITTSPAHSPLTYSPLLALSAAVQNSPPTNPFLPPTVHHLTAACWNLSLTCEYTTSPNCNSSSYFHPPANLDLEIDQDVEHTRNAVRDIVRQVGLCDGATEMLLDKCLSSAGGSQPDPRSSGASVHVFSALAKSVLRKLHCFKRACGASGAGATREKRDELGGICTKVLETLDVMITNVTKVLPVSSPVASAVAPSKLVNVITSPTACP